MKKLRVLWHKLVGAAVVVLLAVHGAPATAQDRVLVYEGEGAFLPLVFGWSDFGSATGKAVDEFDMLPADLSVYDCVVLPANGFDDPGAFAQPTLAALNTYVNGGGRIIAQAERTGGFEGTIAAMNGLAANLGSGLRVVPQELDCEVGFLFTENIDDSPFTEGVEKIVYRCTSEVTAVVVEPNAPNAESLVRTKGAPDTPEGTTFIGLDLIGSGVFVLSGDLNVFSDDSGDGYDADHHNGVLARNICDQVSVSVPQFLLIDEESIDNGNPPNFFTARQINDDRARLGQRRHLRFFKNHAGDKITLHTGQVGDEGWFALKTIPNSWANRGPSDDGLGNFVGVTMPNGKIKVGKGLGRGKDPESKLDKIPDVTPLRASGLKALEGQQVCAVVYDSDISMNYDPLDGSLKGANLGRVAFEVISVKALTGWSSSTLPEVEIEILDAEEVCEGPLGLFTGAPEPDSSSEPFDVEP